eukprot:798494_1
MMTYLNDMMNVHLIDLIDLNVVVLMLLLMVMMIMINDLYYQNLLVLLFHQLLVYMYCSHLMLYLILIFVMNLNDFFLDLLIIEDIFELQTLFILYVYKEGLRMEVN